MVSTSARTGKRAKPNWLNICRRTVHMAALFRLSMQEFEDIASPAEITEIPKDEIDGVLSEKLFDLMQKASKLVDEFESQVLRTATTSKGVSPNRAGKVRR